MMNNTAFLTYDEIEAQMEFMNVLYNGTGPEPPFETASIDHQKKYRSAVGQEEKKETALIWIDVMSSYEFQTRLKKGTLPEFVREEKVCNDPEFSEFPRHPLARQTNHPYEFLPDEFLREGMLTQGYIHRDQLRYYSVEDFIKGYYTG
jgi:hypothetical protein